ncbi:hypothetical protein [Rhizobium phaseoli]|uniref:hypothetical protein n=1 Tax=Rhizobium phaseoli TaxID=396 RepID=UPI0005698EFB|nr:hypothetical protein [Rhizobium phaseoli]MDH6645726.1 hypothetical protein [Rhizobium esperanzae]PCD65553.1 hypothetical protein CO648_21845 [Rhizobium phaseoli]
MNTLSVTFSFNDLKNEFDQFNKEVGRAAFAVQSFMAYTISATYAAHHQAIDILSHDNQSALNRSVGIYVDDSIALSAGRLAVGRRKRQPQNIQKCRCLLVPSALRISSSR